MSILALRSIALLLPLLATAVIWLVRPPGRRQAGAIYLSTLWVLTSIAAVNLLAVNRGWWSYSFQGGGAFQMPVDLLFGWALLWGTLPALIAPRQPSLAVISALALLDVSLMPLCAPLLRLSSHWLTGEALAIAAALIPAQLLARWTLEQSRLGGRALLQMLLFVLLILFFIPTMLLEQTSGHWRNLLSLPATEGQLLFQLALLATLLGVSALQEFAQRGGGTPFPSDPPPRLVRSGFYSYVRNPMQVSAALLLILLGVALGNAAVGFAAGIAVAYSAGLARWSEEAELAERFGGSWLAYREQVRSWLPRWRPRGVSPAILYVAGGCEPCSSIGRWLDHQKPVSLRIIAAELHPELDLDRIRYESADGHSADGVEGFARALEHVHLGWAVLACSARLPLVRPLIQLIMDAVGAGPNKIQRCESAEKI